MTTAFAQIPDGLERLGANPFRVRACRDAARAVGDAALDPTDARCRTARDTSVPVAICADAHSVHEFDILVHGIDPARRGWRQTDDALSTRSLDSRLR